MEKMRDGYVPRLNWYSFVAVGTEKTRTIVPLSEAVASSVPLLLKEMALSALRCASIIVMGCKEMVSNIATSPARLGEAKFMGPGEWAGNVNGEED